MSKDKNATKSNTPGTPKLDLPKDPIEFTLGFIRANRGEFAGVHSVYSSYNEVIRTCFPDINPIELTRDMVAKGLLVESNRDGSEGSPILVKGGALLVIVGEDQKPEKPAKDSKPKLSKKGATSLLKAFGKTETK